MEKYYSGQGKVFAASRDASGNPGVFRYLGNIPGFGVTPEIETQEHKESTSGKRSVDRIRETGKKLAVEMTMESFVAENIAMAMAGELQTIAAGVGLSKVLATAAVGDIVSLGHLGVTNVVITDDAATPAALTEGTHYTLNAAHGSIEFLDLTGFTAPYTIDFDHGGYRSIKTLEATGTELYIRIEAVNTEESEEASVAEFYRVRLTPNSQLAFINDDLSQLTLSGQALIDTTKTSDGEFGQFGRILLPAAA